MSIMEETIMIPQLKECVIKACDDFIWDSTRSLLLQSLKEDTSLHQQIIRIPEGSHIIIFCCLNGYIELISIFVDNGFSVNHNLRGGLSNYFNSMLHFATVAKQLPLMKYLVSNGAVLDQPSELGITPIHCIFKSIQGYLDGKQTDNNSGKMYLPAVTHTETEALTFLLKSGCDVNVKASHTEFSTLHYAVAERNIDHIRLLIEYGADVNNVRDGYRDTPLVFAITSLAPSCDIVELLLDSGTNMNLLPCEGSILHLAVETESQSIVELLLDRGVNVNAKDFLDQTPLYKYVFNIACTPVDFEFIPVGEEGINIVGTLLIWGADFNTVDDKGRTLLHWAAWQGSIHLVKLILEHCPAVNDKKDNLNKKPIHYAADRAHHDIVHLLIMAEVDPSDLHTY